MMSLGYVGNGGSSSSSSNLSPLAPPFTVDRSNPKPNSNQLSHFTEPPYGMQNWSYPHSTAPRQDFVVDSVTTGSMPSETDYTFSGSESVNPQTSRWSPPNPSFKPGSDWSSLSPEPVNPQTTHWSSINPGVKTGSDWPALNPSPNATESFTYLSEAKPFYTPYVANEDDPLVALNEPSYDLLSTSGLVSLVDGSCQVDYTQTLSGLEYVPQWEGIWSGGPSEANRGKRMEADDSFFSEEAADIAGSLVYKNYIKSGSLAAESVKKGKEDSTLSLGNYTDFIGRENRIEHSVTGKLDGKMFSAQNHGLIPVDLSKAPSLRSFPTFSESRLQGSTPDPLKEPWNNQKPYTIYEKRFQMFDAGMSDILSATKSSHSLVIKPPAVSTTVSGSSKASLKNEVSSQTLRNDQHTFLAPSSTKEEVLKLNNMSSKSDLDFGSKVRSAFQLPDINIADVESIETVKSEDSPCWKGAAPASPFSSFTTLDEATPQHPSKKLQTSNGMNLHTTLINRLGNDSPKVSSLELCEKTMVNVNVCADNGFALSPKITAASKLSSSKEHGSLRESNSDSDIKTSRTQLPNLKEGASQVGTGEHVVHAVESVLFPDREGAAKPATAVAMNAQMLVKSMHDLSALLLYHCSNDANALKEKDHLALGHVICNLNVCLSRKIVQGTSTRDSVLPRLDTSNKAAENSVLPRLDTSNKAAENSVLHRLDTSNKAASFHDQFNSHCAPDEKRNGDLTGKKFEKLKGLLSLRDDADFSKDHNMIQAIKKVLDENLESEEESQSQTLLYKNLWLEAEAELCSISYRARFERMKREMEKCKLKTAKDVSENNAALAKLSTLKISHEPNATNKGTPKGDLCPNLTTTIQESPVSCSNSHVDNVESSVMARFNILKRRGEQVDINVEEQEGQPETKKFDAVVGPRLGHQNVTDDLAVMQSRGANRIQNQAGSGWYNSSYSSSEWEHVMKDEFALQN